MPPLLDHATLVRHRHRRGLPISAKRTKSLEDTALYRYHALLALNEVGSNPTAAGLPASEFHALLGQRAKHAPHGLTATATFAVADGFTVSAGTTSSTSNYMILSQGEAQLGNTTLSNGTLRTTSGNIRLLSGKKLTGAGSIFQNFAGNPASTISPTGTMLLGDLNHNGQIDVFSAGPGRGSQFRVSLPLTAKQKETEHRYQAA